MISKAERAELRSIVRGQFKVLRSEIEHRRAELNAENERVIAEQFADEDRSRAAIADKISEIVGVAERECTDALVNGVDGGCGYSIRRPVRLDRPRLDWPDDDRKRLRRQMLADLEAKVRNASVRLDRQEADLLRTLAVDAIESDEARAFLAAIPTVGQLVPSTAMPELDG